MKKKRPKIWLEARTYVIAAVLAVLVWLYAESNTLETGRTQIAVEFVPQNRKALHVKPDPFTIDLKYRCTKGTVRQVDELDGFVFKIKDDPNATSVKRVVSLADMLRAYEPLRRLNITIDSVDPATKEIEVHRLVTEKRMVKAATFRDLLINPDDNVPDAQVTLPQEVFDNYRDFSLQVRLEELANDDLPHNTSQTKELAIRLPDDIVRRLNNLGYNAAEIDAVIEPNTTFVTFTVSDPSQEYELGKVRVSVKLPFDAVGKYKLEIDRAEEYQDDITVRGSPTAIANIERDPSLIELYVTLTHEELEAGRVQKTVSVIKPADIELVNALALVSFKATKLNNQAPALPDEPETDEAAGETPAAPPSESREPSESAAGE